LNNNQCNQCPPGFYNLDLELNSLGPCLLCDSTSSLCLGGSQITTRSGYWRLNKTANLFFQCPNPNACIGTNETVAINSGEIFNFTSTCAPGYNGHLCNTCDSKKAKFGGDSICVDCHQDAIYYLKLIGTIFGQVIVIVLTVKSAWEQPPDAEKEKEERLKANLMKILINYSQIINLASNFSVRWPGTTTVVLQASSKVSFALDQVFSIECFFALASSQYQLRVFYIKCILVSLIPFVIFLNWAICSGTTQLLQKIKQKKQLDEADTVPGPLSMSITIILVIVIYLQPNMLLFFLQLFICRNLYRLDIPDYYLASDYELKCWDMII